MFWLMLEGGPCAGAYFTARAPGNLKATVGAKGRRDVLDLPTDEARDDEDIHLYERTSAHSEGILCSRAAGCGHIVGYRYVRPLRGQGALFEHDGASA
ncbi:MAG: hypothetical protein ACLP50_29330 [Solirubrobacteraceae bacterium]